MPKLGLTMTEATLVAWHKEVKEPVKRGEVLFEFESEKATMEYESPADGVLSEILVQPGTSVPCGAPVAVLQTDAEAAAAQAQPGAAVQTCEVWETSQVLSGGDAVITKTTTAATPAAKRRARELGVDLSALNGRGPGGRIHLADVEAAAQTCEVSQTSQVSVNATPLAAALAQDLGVELAGILGSGPGGRILREDVIATVRTRLASGGARATTPSPPASSPEHNPYASIEPLQGVRAVIARRISESAFTAPHVTLFTEADATALVAARQQLNVELAGQTKFSYNTLLVALTARALREHPDLNACLVDNELRRYADIHIALAVDTKRGLLAPVIRHADQLDLLTIQQQVVALVARALAGKTLPEDLSGGTFTITNLGAQEIDGFTPIINQPQAAILGVGRIAARPAVVEGQLAVRQTMILSLSFDHRIVDGAPAARFLQRLKHLIERPFVLAISGRYEEKK